MRRSPLENGRLRRSLASRWNPPRRMKRVPRPESNESCAGQPRRVPRRKEPPESVESLSESVNTPGLPPLNRLFLLFFFQNEKKFIFLCDSFFQLGVQALDRSSFVKISRPSGREPLASWLCSTVPPTRRQRHSFSLSRAISDPIASPNSRETLSHFQKRRQPFIAKQLFGCLPSSPQRKPGIRPARPVPGSSFSGVTVSSLVASF